MESTTRAIGYKPDQETLQESVVRENRTLRSMRRVAGNTVVTLVRQSSTRQLIKESRVPVPMKPGQEARQDFEYERCGVANIFLASEPLRGKRYVEVTERRTKADWAVFIKQIADEWYKDAKKITLVMDNLATHKAAALYEVYPPRQAKRMWDRFEFVYTPKHGSWLNMAEIELNVLMGQCLNRRIDNIKTMKQEVNAWKEHRNNKKVVINWQFTNKEAKG